VCSLNDTQASSRRLEVYLSSDKCRLSDDFEEVTRGTLLREQGQDRSIHGC
jgi:hypothetical protein